MENHVLNQSIEFSLEIFKYCRKLDSNRHFAVSNQLLRCGTSIGANVSEAQRAHSKKDFVAKMIIAAKEAQESSYWLHLCQKDAVLPDPGELKIQLLSIQKLISAIIRSCRNKDE